MTKKIENCEICGETLIVTWTDFYGQATCVNCGAPYQLLEPSGATKGLTYPYLDLNSEFKEVFKEYYQQTKKCCRIGTYVEHRSGLREEHENFKKWLKQYHPKFLAKESGCGLRW